VSPTLMAPREVAAAFARFPHWQTSESQRREVRTALYRPLLKAKVPASAEVVDRLIKTLGQASP
jgi:hypothetical protein